MSLQIIYGRAGSGKSSFCYGDIKKSIKAGNKIPLILIVPEQFSLQAELNIVEMLGASGLNSAEVLSFKRLAYRVLSEEGGISRRKLTQTGKSMLIYSIMDKIKEDLKVFGASARRKGFVDNVCNIISEMKRYNVTADKLTQVGKEFDANDSSVLRDKLNDISLIYSKYESQLANSYLDLDDDLSLLSEKLDKCSLLDGCQIWIDAFSGFTPQEYDIIEKLMKKANKVSITLCTDCLEDKQNITGVELFAPTQQTCHKLNKIANTNQIKIENPVPINCSQSPRFISKDIAHIEKKIYSFGKNIYDTYIEGLNIYRASSMYSEVEEVARDIIEQCREKNYKFGEVAVVTGDISSYASIIQAVFSQYQIPFFIDNKRDILGHPLVVLLISAMQIYNSNWSYEVVFRYLKTGLTGINIHDIDILENYVLANGIRGNKWTKEQKWTYGLQPALGIKSSNAYDEYVVEKSNGIRDIIIKPLKAFNSKLKGRKKVVQICTALFELLCDLEIPEQLEGLVEFFKEKGQLEQANEYSQIWNMLMDVLNQIVEISGQNYITMEKFIELVEVGIKECKMGLIPPAIEQVMVGTVERSKSNAVKAYYILGANDGVFPMAIKDEGILTDIERDYLRNLGVELATDTRNRVFEQQFLIYTVLSIPSHYLHISYSVSDSKGKSMRQSPIINKLERMFPKLEIKSNVQSIESEQKKICNENTVFNDLIAAIKRGSEGYQTEDWWKDIYSWYASKQEWKEKFDVALKAFYHTNQEACVSVEKTKRLYGSNINTSISRLEKYISCPFAYYIQYGLKARDRKVFRLSAPDMGTFLHEILDRFSRRVHEEGYRWRDLEREWCIEIINQEVEKMLNELKDSVFTGTRRYAYLTGRLKRTLIRAVWIIAEQIKRGGFEPIGYEVGFGIGEQMPPITIELPSGEKLILNGRIDRVDALKTDEGTYLRIIDYKSGSKAFKLSEVYHGMQIQLLTYLDAIWQNGIKNMEGPILPGGMLYFKIDDPILKGGRKLTDEDIEREIMKQLKLKGLLLADVKLIREMDRDIEGDSIIIPARINKDDNLGRSSAATLEQFGMLRKHVKELLVNIGNEMLTGNIKISPYKNRKITACKYCDYLTVCQFDTSMKDNEYRILKDLKDDEVWKLMGGEGNE